MGSVGLAPGDGRPPTERISPVPVRHVDSASALGAVWVFTEPRAVAMKSATVPSKQIRPPSRMITRSHSAATSSVWWVANNTVPHCP